MVVFIHVHVVTIKLQREKEREREREREREMRKALGGDQHITTGTENRDFQSVSGDTETV